MLLLRLVALRGTAVRQVACLSLPVCLSACLQLVQVATTCVVQPQSGRQSTCAFFCSGGGTDLILYCKLRAFSLDIIVSCCCCCCCCDHQHHARRRLDRRDLTVSPFSSKLHTYNIVSYFTYSPLRAFACGLSGSFAHSIARGGWLAGWLTGSSSVWISRTEKDLDTRGRVCVCLLCVAYCIFGYCGGEGLSCLVLVTARHLTGDSSRRPFSGHRNSPSDHLNLHLQSSNKGVWSRAPFWNARRVCSGGC